MWKLKNNMNTSLHSIFSKLQTKVLTAHNCYAADNIPFFDMHKIGISHDGFPIFFINSPTISSFSNIKLDLILIQFNQLCRLKLPNTVRPIENYYTIVALQTDNSDYINYFIDVVGIVLNKIGNCPTQKQLYDEIQKLVNLFRCFNLPPQKTIQGLWAELFTIYRGNDPEYLLKAWHSSVNDVYDFNDGIDKIEVKSTSKSYRIHRFSYSQLSCSENSNLLISSIFVIPSGIGKNIFDLKEDIETKICSLELRYKLNEIIFRTLGSEFEKAYDLYFDYQQAIDSYKLIPAICIPSLNAESIPCEINNIHFDCDLSQIDAPDNIATIYPHSKLFSSL